MNSRMMRTTAAVVLTGSVVAGCAAAAPGVSEAADRPGGGYGLRSADGSAAGRGPAAVSGTQAQVALTTRQEKALLHLAEEEKLAHDIYVLAHDEYGLRVFTNIARAETRHEAAMVRLLSRYGLPDPTDGSPAGEFTDPDLQALYDKLAKRVMKSEAVALRVGKKIERLDIRDIKDAKAGMPSDATRVLINLLQGSRNHLRAFKMWSSR